MAADAGAAPRFTVYNSNEIPADVMAQCVTLHREHYGPWSTLEANAPLLQAQKLQPGARAKMSIPYLQRTHLGHAACRLVTAHIGELQVGQVFFTTYDVPPSASKEPPFDVPRRVRWITQLVVHADYRRRHIAATLLGHATADKADLFAVGLVSSHPGAVRSVELSTLNLCADAEQLAVLAPPILAASSVPYLKGVTLVPGKCTVDVKFFVEHANVLRILAADPSWRLGPLSEGHEFCAISLVKKPW